MVKAECRLEGRAAAAVEKFSFGNLRIFTQMKGHFFASSPTRNHAGIRVCSLSKINDLHSHATLICRQTQPFLGVITEC